jgi:hypothetical protein
MTRPPPARDQAHGNRGRDWAFDRARDDVARDDRGHDDRVRPRALSRELGKAGAWSHGPS